MKNAWKTHEKRMKNAWKTHLNAEQDVWTHEFGVNNGEFALNVTNFVLKNDEFCI